MFVCTYVCVPMYVYVYIYSITVENYKLRVVITSETLESDGLGSNYKPFTTYFF